METNMNKTVNVSEKINIKMSPSITMSTKKITIANQELFLIRSWNIFLFMLLSYLNKYQHSLKTSNTLWSNGGYDKNSEVCFKEYVKVDHKFKNVKIKTLQRLQLSYKVYKE